MSFELRTAKREPDEIQEARAAIDEWFAQKRTIGAIQADPEGLYVVASLIRQVAQDQFNLTDPTPLFFERKTGPGLGNWLELTETVNTAHVVRRSLGGKPKVFTPHNKKWAISLEDFRLDMGIELERVLTGQMQPSLLADHMAEAISRHYVEAGLSAIDVACAAAKTDAYGKSVRTEIAGVLTDTGLKEGIKRLAEVNSDLVIAGRFSALYPMLGFTGYSEETLREIERTGAIGKYLGATVVVLRDNYNEFFKKPSVPNTRVYLCGADKGGWLVEEDMSALDYQTVDAEEQHMRLGTKLRASFYVYKPWRYHVVQIIP